MLDSIYHITLKQLWYHIFWCEKKSFTTYLQCCLWPPLHSTTNYGPRREKTCLRCLRTTNAQTSLCISAV